MLSELLANNKVKIIDLSIPLKNSLPYRGAPEIKYESHKEGAIAFCNRHDVLKEDFFEELDAMEIITLMSHSGTHLDAPWHYGSMSEGRRAKTVDQIPLKWCCGEGVVLDFTHKQKGELITKEDIVEALAKINYTLKPHNIVLIRTDASKHFEEPEYPFIHPGMSREATLWLIDQGIKVVGIDSLGWDSPVDVQVAEYKKGIRGKLWAAHLVGREREY